MLAHTGSASGTELCALGRSRTMGLGVKKPELPLLGGGLPTWVRSLQHSRLIHSYEEGDVKNLRALSGD